MKKKLVWFLVLTGLFLAVNGCRQDDGDAHSPESGADEIALRARDFLEFQAGSPLLPDVYYRSGGATTRSGSAAFADCLLPDWTRAVTGENERDYITEIPTRLIRPVYYGARVLENGEEVSFNRELAYTLLIVNEQKEADLTFAFLATFLRDESYTGSLETLHGDPSGTDFSGIVLYSALDGRPIYGARYETGEITKWLCFNPDAGLEADPTRIYLGVWAEDVETRGVNDLNEIEEIVVVGKRRGSGMPEFPPDPMTYEFPQDIFPLSYVSEGPGGGGGSTSSPEPEPKKDEEPTDPCRNMKHKMADLEFKKMLDELPAFTGADYEAGRAYRYNSTGYTFFEVNGKPGEPEIKFTPPPGSNLDGFIHTHSTNLDESLPIFSPFDVLIPGDWDAAGGLRNLRNFSMGVVTWEGTFFLRVNNLEEYRRFYREYSSSDEKKEKWEMACWGFTQPDMSGDEMVMAFANLMRLQNTGLILMKKSGDKFEMIYYDEFTETLIKKRC